MAIRPEDVGPGLGVQSSSRQPTDEGDGWVPKVVLHELSPVAPLTRPLPLLLLLTKPELLLSTLLPSLLTNTGTETLFGELCVYKEERKKNLVLIKRLIFFS